jgi:Meiotically up-regulated gene 113
MLMEFVYIIQCSEYKMIKIGRTAGNPYNRIGQIKTANPFPINIIRIIECDLGTEAALHYQFSSYRVHGEWFKDECLSSVLDATAGYEEHKRTRQRFSVSPFPTENVTVTVGKIYPPTQN